MMHKNNNSHKLYMSHTEGVCYIYLMVWRTWERLGGIYACVSYSHGLLSTSVYVKESSRQERCVYQNMSEISIWDLVACLWVHISTYIGSDIFGYIITYCAIIDFCWYTSRIIWMFTVLTIMTGALAKPDVVYIWTRIKHIDQNNNQFIM